MRTDKVWCRRVLVLIATGTFIPVLAGAVSEDVQMQGYSTFAKTARSQIKMQAIQASPILKSLVPDLRHTSDLSANLVHDSRPRPSMPTPDGRYIVTVTPGKNNELSIYQAPKYSAVATSINPVKTVMLSEDVQGHLTNQSTSSVISKDGKYAYIRTKSGNIDKINMALWEKESTLDSGTVSYDNAAPNSLILSADGGTLYGAHHTTAGPRFVVYDVNNGKSLAYSFKSSEDFELKKDGFLNMALAADGEHIYFIGDGSNKVFKFSLKNPDNLVPVRVGDGHNHHYGIATSPNGKYVVTGHSTQATAARALNVFVIDLEANTTKPITIKSDCVALACNVFNVAFSPDSSDIYALYGYTESGFEADPSSYFAGMAVINVRAEQLLGNKNIEAQGFISQGDMSDFVAPRALLPGDTLSVSSVKELHQFGFNNFINMNNGTLVVEDDIDATTHVVSLHDRGTIDTNGHAMTVSSLVGANSVLFKQGDGALTILHDSPFLTQGFVGVAKGELVVASNQSLGSDASVYIFNGAMLRTTAAHVVVQGGIILGLGGGVLSTAAGSTLTAWMVGDSDSTRDGQQGPLLKVGAGTLELNDPPAGLTYTGDIYLNEGKTIIRSELALGAGDAGRVNFEGGTLAVDPATAVTIAKAMKFGGQGGTIAVDNTTSGLTLSGVLEGPGGLTKVGPGSMTIRGVGTYAGDTNIQAGTLTVRGGKALNAAALVNVESGAMFEVQEAQTIGALGGGGRVLLTESLTIGGSNRDSNFYGTFAGPGGVIKMGTARAVMNGDSVAFTGPITINGGQWVMGGDEETRARVSSPVTVNAGGQLSGSGTVGALTVTDGGIVAPGNSIGTLTVTGNVSLESGSLYIAEIGQNGTSDHIAATGQVTLAGQLQLEALEAYEPGTRYTLVTATGGRSGEFSHLGKNLPLLDLQLSYDENHAYLGVTRNETPMDELGANENEIKTAVVLEEFDTGSPSYDAIISLETVSEVQAALGQLSGDMHASVKSALVQDSHFLRDATLDRLQAAFTPAGEVRKPVVAYSKTGQLYSAPADTKDKVFWTQVFGAWGQTNSDGNAAKLNQMSAGAFFGIDTRVGENWRVGGLMGYSTMTLHLPSHHSSGHSDAFHLGVYGAGQWAAWGLRAGAGYSWYDLQDKRAVDFKNYSDSLKSQYRASTVQLFGEIGYRMNPGRLLLEPFINAAVVSADIGKLNEAGSYTALHGDSSKMTSAFTTLGVHGSSYFPLKHVQGMVRLTLGWRRAYGKLIPSSAHAFTGRNEVMTIAGAPIDRNAAVLKAGVDLATTKRVTVGLTYAGEMSRKTQSHSGELNLTWKF